LTGGANANPQDPFATQLLAGCRPQMCYVDDYRSYSTNETAINYVSAMAWMASFLADQGDPESRSPSVCRVKYRKSGASQGGGRFTAELAVTNTGNTPVVNWTLRFAFTGDQQVRDVRFGKGGQTGPLVTIANESYNATIPPGGTVTVGFSANTTVGANPAPTLFTLNGIACDM
jgi:endoglucanase